jgi:NADPH:quinone reductase
MSKLIFRHFSSNLTKAAVCEALNKPLVYRDWDLGILPPDQVKIEVVAAGINFGDLLQSQGKYQEKLDPPFVSGMECAGRIIEIGSQVKPGKFLIGDRVICIGQKGFAKHAMVPPASIIPLPRSLPESTDLAEAAALLVSYGTAHLALTSQGKLKAGESVLITAAAGGVGLASVELARFNLPSSLTILFRKSHSLECAENMVRESSQQQDLMRRSS